MKLKKVEYCWNERLGFFYAFEEDDVVVHEGPDSVFPVEVAM